MQRKWTAANAVVLSLFAAQAIALMEAKIKLTDAYATGAHTVAAGTVENLDAERSVAEVKLTTVFKAPAGGWAEGETIKVQIAKPEGFFKTVSKGGAVVIFRADEGDLVNVANRWVLGKTLASGKTIRVAGFKDDSRGTFPGSTEALVAAIAEVKDGKSTLLNVAPPKFLAAQEKVAEGDKAESLFTKPADEKDALASAVGKFDEKGRERKLVLTKQGLKLAADESAKLPEVSDMELMGSHLIDNITEWRQGLTSGTLVVCDVNADGRIDAVVTSAGKLAVLLNRGFGCYLLVVPRGEAFENVLNAKGGDKGGLVVLRKGEKGLEAWTAGTPDK